MAEYLSFKEVASELGCDLKKVRQLVMEDKVKTEDFFSHAAAMVLGDFLGCFIVITIFNVCIDLAFRLMERKRKKG